MTASLPMYDLPELMEAHQHFWQGLRNYLNAEGVGNAPAALDWPQDLDAAWLAPDLLISQTCGYPLRRQLAGRVRLLGVPHYDVPGCSGYSYSSALIVREASGYRRLSELAEGIAAFNEIGSQSGYSALRHAIAPFARSGRFFAGTIETGRHENSVDAVREGTADIAAIDAVTLALLQQHQPTRLDGIRVLDFTTLVPGLPFITAHARVEADVTRMQRALRNAFADPALDDARASLRLKQISFPDPAIYHDIDRLEREAMVFGYHALG